MVRLCICDDREADIRQLQEMAQSFFAEHPEFPFHIETFRSAFDVLDRIGESGDFDLYLLDILMPNFSGMDLARAIRKRNETAEILFLTVSREYAIEAFSVKASNYLVKPVQKTDFDRELLSCIDNLAPKDNPSLVVKTKGGLRKVYVQDLKMIESFNHRQVCTLANGTTLETTTTLRALFDELSTYPYFRMPHRSYIVHLDYVSEVSSSELVLCGGKRVPISRKAHADFKAAFLDYMIWKNTPTDL